MSVRTLERVRQGVAEDGLAAPPRPKPRLRLDASKLAGEREARLIAPACSAPPAGKRR